MSPIQDEIEAFNQLKPQLEAEHMGKWALLHDRQLIGLYVSFDAAADIAVDRFGSGPFLIRQIGAKPTPLPASLAYKRPSA